MIYFLHTLILSNWSKWIPENYIIDQDNEEYKKERAGDLNSLTDLVRIPELFQNYQNYDLFPPNLHYDTFYQGEIGDCYFLDIVSLVLN